MKFAEIQKGSRAERVVDLPGLLTQSGNPVPLVLRPLNDEEDVEVLARAAEMARSRGGTADVGDALYRRTVMVETLMRGCLDKDSPPAAREPFFDSIQQISKALDPEAIAMLFEMHEEFQNECSPRLIDLEHGELYERILAITALEVSVDPFAGLARGTRSTLGHIMARLCVHSPELRSHFGLPSLPSSATPAQSDGY